MSDSSNSKLLGRIGWGVTGLSVLALLASASMKIMQEAHNIEYVVGRFGYPASALVPLGVLELTCTLIYAWPSTSMLGAVLLTGYLGAQSPPMCGSASHSTRPSSWGFWCGSGCTSATRDCEGYCRCGRGKWKGSDSVNGLRNARGMSG